MELAQEEYMGSNDLTQTIKGKRTKRQRSSSPPPKAAGEGLTVSSGSSSGCGHEGGGGEEYGSISSHTSCSEVYESTEEEDMANCLILLAQGDGPRLKNDESNRIEKFSSRKFSQISSSTSTNKAGFYVYECKTCNRSFPSFQALGGHRASHKKPKPEEKKVLVAAPPASILVHDDDGHDNLDDCQLNKSSSSSPDPHPPPPLALQISNINSNKIHSKAKIHECSICGSEFTSGQALGGHMRRHRANTAVNNNQVVAISTTISDVEIKPRTILSLDLNLPAPEDDLHHRESKFQFVSTQQALVFSAAPALVDCHY